MEVACDEHTNGVGVLLTHVHTERDGTVLTSCHRSASVAAVVAHRVQRGGFSHVNRTVGETVDGGGARISLCEFLLCRPSVQGELVLVGARSQRNGDCVHAIRVVVRHHSARAAPAVESAVDVHLAIRASVLAHVHLERHVHCSRSWSVVARTVTSAVEIVGGRTSLHLAVGVTSKISDWSARGTVHHVVDQVLLVGKAVDRVLVFHRARQIGDSHRVHTVAVVVGHGVVHIVRAPSTPWSSHKHVCEIGRGTRHVHVERDTHVATTRSAGLASVAAVVANHTWACSTFHHVPDAVHELTGRQRARFRAVKLLSKCPIAVAQELVLLCTWLHSQGDGVHTIAIGIVHEVGGVVPAVECACHGH